MYVLLRGNINFYSLHPPSLDSPFSNIFRELKSKSHRRQAGTPLGDCYGPIMKHLLAKPVKKPFGEAGLVRNEEFPVGAQTGWAWILTV